MRKNGMAGWAVAAVDGRRDAWGLMGSAHKEKEEEEEQGEEEEVEEVGGY